MSQYDEESLAREIVFMQLDSLTNPETSLSIMLAVAFNPAQHIKPELWLRRNNSNFYNY